MQDKEEDGSKTPGVKVHTSDEFLFLDMKLYYRGDQLHFGLYRKENQELRYLNKASTHTPRRA